MKHSKSAVRCKFSSLPKLRFDDQQLTSYSGLIIFQTLFVDLDLKTNLGRCFSHRQISPIFSTASVVMLLIVHLLIGYRSLRHVRYYDNDPIVLRVLGLSKLPDVSTISRQLGHLDDRSVSNIERLQQSMVLETIAKQELARVTLDFDGSVLGTCRHAEGVAIGFNRKKKGQRSYYPLYCTIAQTAQVLAVHHRSGNHHDSFEALEFIRQCIENVRKTRPQAIIETRMDGAFFSEDIVAMLDKYGVEYTLSVPFERYTTIKCFIDDRHRWNKISDVQSFFEKNMSLKSWKLAKHRFVFVRQRNAIQNKQPIQLDLFHPKDYNYQYKVIITNKRRRPARIVGYHEGRGTQEGLFAELKSQLSMSYIPCNTWNGNKVFMLSALMAHNLTRELQIRHHQRSRCTTTKRPSLWVFTQIGTLRRNIIQRAGRLIRPDGTLTLSMAANDAIESELARYLSTERFVV